VYLLILLAAATLASVSVLQLKLGSSYRSVYGFIKSGLIATLSGALSFAVVCSIAVLNQAQAQRHYFPKPIAASAANAVSAASKRAGTSAPQRATTQRRGRPGR
jgi:hypothetical protein